jgi:hypothetical protein
LIQNGPEGEQIGPSLKSVVLSRRPKAMRFFSVAAIPHDKSTIPRPRLLPGKFVLALFSGPHSTLNRHSLALSINLALKETTHIYLEHTGDEGAGPR